MGIKKFVVLCVLVSASLLTYAQKGTLRGTVTDQKSKEPLVGATILLEGTTTGTITDFDGNYLLGNIAPGTYRVRCSFISYETKSVANIQVKAGQTVDLNFLLGESTVEIEAVAVVAKANRESESMLLVQQKNAVIAVQAIGAQEISRKGASDAEAAVTKVSGISKKEGENNVFVRGLGDRFNATLLNGFPVPSQDPEYKNISLDFFSSDIIKAVGVNKVFSGSMSGDVGGAEINISSKELSGDQAFSADLSAGANTNTVSEHFQLASGVNGLGFANNKTAPASTSAYTFANSLDPSGQDFQLNRGIALSAGKKILAGQAKTPLNLYLIGTYSTDFNYESGLLRETLTDANISREVSTDKYKQKTSSLLMANANYTVNKTDLSYNALYIRTSELFFGDYNGVDKDFFQDVADQGAQGLLRRQEVIDNSLFVNQINSVTNLSSRNTLEAGVSYNMVSGNQPDRRQNYLSYQGNNLYNLTLGQGYQLREFLELKENDLNGKVIFTRKISSANDKNQARIGYSGRYITDEFNSNTFDLSVLKSIAIPADAVVLDDVFNQANLDNGTFRATNYEQTYSVDKFIHAAFGEITYAIGKKTTANLGLRGDMVDIKMAWNVNKGGNVGSNQNNFFYFLPSLNLKQELNEKNSLRLGASRTYTLPQTKEMSPFRYNGRDFNSQGNQKLKPSVNLNLDLKWDFYLSSDELISVTAYGKVIQDPISRIEVASAGGYLSYENIADNAFIGGTEIEIRKNIHKTMDAEGNGSKLSIGFNGSYLKTDLKLRTDISYLKFTNTKSQLEGAAPVIVNADISWEIKQARSSWTNSLVANYFSDRIYTIGTGDYQDINEDGMTTLDFISSAKLGKHFGIGLKARNLLDPTFRLSRKPSIDGADPITLREYKKGMNFGISISYTL